MYINWTRFFWIFVVVCLTALAIEVDVPAIYVPLSLIAGFLMIVCSAEPHEWEITKDRPRRNFTTGER